jgi:hypothetical protein
MFFRFITSQGRSNRGSLGGGGEGWSSPNNLLIAIILQASCKFRHTKTLFSDHQNSVKTFPKSRKWLFRDSKLKNFLGPLALVLNPQSKRDSYGTTRFCNASVRKICVFLFVNCVFIHFKHLRGFVGHEMVGNVFRHPKCLAYSPPPQLYMLATALLPFPVANISGKNFLGALFILKVPLETEPPPNFFILPTPW